MTERVARPSISRSWVVVMMKLREEQETEGSERILVV
jgi:hypothetical protein